MYVTEREEKLRADCMQETIVGNCGVIVPHSYSLCFNAVRC